MLILCKIAPTAAFPIMIMTMNEATMPTAGLLIVVTPSPRSWNMVSAISVIPGGRKDNILPLARSSAMASRLDMAVRYCPEFEVRDMGANFKKVTLDGDNSTIRLGFAEETPGFRFDVSTEQGQLLVDKNLVHILQQGENQPGIADVLGVYGGGRVPGPRAGNVNIRVRNGTVRFSK